MFGILLIIICYCKSTHTTHLLWHNIPIITLQLEDISEIFLKNNFVFLLHPTELINASFISSHFSKLFSLAEWKIEIKWNERNKTYPTNDFTFLVFPLAVHLGNKQNHLAWFSRFCLRGRWRAISVNWYFVSATTFGRFIRRLSHFSLVLEWK